MARRRKAWRIRTRASCLQAWTPLRAYHLPERRWLSTLRLCSAFSRAPRARLPCSSRPGYVTDASGQPHLPGQRTMEERRRNLKAFKDGDIRFMICTDVAARGLDIKVRRESRSESHSIPRMKRIIARKVSPIVFMDTGIHGHGCSWTRVFMDTALLYLVQHSARRPRPSVHLRVIHDARIAVHNPQELPFVINMTLNMSRSEVA